MRNLGVLGGDLLDVPDEELIPGSVVADIPAVLLVTGEDLLRSDSVILPDSVLITGVLEVLLDSGAVADDDLLAGDHHLDGDMGDSLTVDGVVEVPLLQDIAVLPHYSAVLDAGGLQDSGEDIGGVAASATEQVVVIDVLVDLLFKFPDEAAARVVVHIVVSFFQYKDTTIF